MLRSLNSGISGMKVNQEKMDVIGNNIANVGTTAFKGGSVRFEDMFSQATKGAAGATTSSGGVNSNQIGLGVQLSGVDTIMVQGLMQSTGRNLDVGIDGEGYFMVGKGPEVYDSSLITTNNGTADSNHTVTGNTAKLDINYTRDGSFNLDDSGNLVTSDGSRILGYSVSTDGASQSIDSTNGDINYIDTTDTITNPIKSDDTNLRTLKIPEIVKKGGVDIRVTAYAIGKDGLITATLDDGSVTAIGQIAMSSFSNPAGLTNVGNNQFKISSNSGNATIKSGLVTAGTDNSKGYGDMNQGSLEMSNVDLAEQFTDMIVTNRAFQANSKTITTSDEMLQSLIGLIR